jgi:hypoxanthine phosphoribosyltransferase
VLSSTPCCPYRYALKELIKDVTAQLALVQDPTERARLAETTKFGIFVVHNKLKEKAAEIPAGVAYFAGMDIPDVWVDYPWEMVDILQHDELKRQDDAEAAAAKQ